jgi:hypothetical protein
MTDRVGQKMFISTGAGVQNCSQGLRQVSQKGYFGSTCDSYSP